MGEMYSAVPPPGHVEEPSSCSSSGVCSEDKNQEEKRKPHHVQDHQWKKFCELKSRRESELSTGTAKRIASARKKALRSVSEQLSETDREIVEEQGVSLPQVVRRKGKRKRGHGGGKEEKAHKSTESRESLEVEWKEVRSFLDPNPQLRGVAPGRYAPKSMLEEEMDDCIEKGEFQEAVELSEKLAQREFASKVTTAFDCRDYTKRKKIEDERKKKRKPAKLKWRFEPKQPWEMKGNM